jgi:hypothetical protein
MRGRQNDSALGVSRPRVIDFAAATTMLSAFALALTLLFTTCVSCTVTNLGYDLLPILRVVDRFYRH